MLFTSIVDNILFQVILFENNLFSDVKISKRVAYSAAVNVINNHKAAIEEIHKSKIYSNSDRKLECFKNLTLTFIKLYSSIKPIMYYKFSSIVILFSF